MFPAAWSWPWYESAVPPRSPDRWALNHDQPAGTRDSLETFATHLCVILERDAFLHSQQQSALAGRFRQFQRALLDHVSNEIKMPVAVIQGSVDQLASHPELLGEIREAAARLGRVTTQLVTLSRAESGLIQPTFEICAIRDLMGEIALPKLPGIKILKNLREWSQVPVFILSVRDQPDDKVEALEAGADDYVTKPFEPTELLARSRAIMRRRENRIEDPVFVNGCLEIDFPARRVKVADS